jgi:outer membrane protein, heavy metal efflux system
LANNPEMQAFRFEEDSARGQMTKAKLPSFSNPVIEGGMSLKDRPAEDPGSKFRNNRISLSQSFEIAGQRGLRIDTAASNMERTRLEIRDLERKLRADIRDAFAEAVFRRERERLSREYLRLQEELAELVSVKYGAGDVAALEVNLSRVELARAQREAIAASTEYGNALLSLKNLIGLPGGEAMIIEGELAVGLPVLPEREALLTRVADRPDSKAADAEIKRSESAAALIRREAIPNLTWSVFRSRDEDLNEWGGMLGISIPLFDRKQAERTEAQTRLSQARIREAGLKKTIEKEINMSYASAQSSLRELELLKKAVLERTAENLELLQLAFKEGKISFYDVRIAQREMFDSRYAYLQALLAADRAFTALEKSIGGELK